MTIVVSVKGDVKAITKDLDKVQRKIVPQVTARALNTTARDVRKVGIRKLAGVLGVPQKFIRSKFDKFGAKGKDRIYIRKARTRELFAIILFSTTGIPAILLRARQNRKGVQTNSGFFKSAFIAKGKGGARQVFKRKSRPRLPIAAQKIPLNPQGTTVMDREVKASGPIFVKHFERLLAQKLNR